MLNSLMQQLRAAVARKESNVMLSYHLGRVQGFCYSLVWDDWTATGARNEAKFLTGDYATRHGGGK